MKRFTNRSKKMGQIDFSDGVQFLFSGQSIMSAKSYSSITENINIADVQSKTSSKKESAKNSDE